MAGSIRWLEVLAIGIYTLQVSGSALMVALMLFCRTLPGVVLGAFTGTLASRFRRKSLLIVGMVVATLNSLLMLLLASVGWASLELVAVGAFINGIVWTLEHPVRRTLLGEVVSADYLRQAMSFDQFTVNGTRLLGPLVGGAVYAMLGLPGIYALSVTGFVIALLLAVRLTANPARVAAENESFSTSLEQGLRYIARMRVLRGILLFTVVVNFFGFSYVSMVPLIGQQLLALGPVQTGILQSMEGAGALLASIFLTLSNRSFRYARSCALGGLMFMSLLVPFALSQWFLFSCLALLVAGISIGFFGAMQSTTLLNQSAASQRSRVMGVLVVCIGAAPVGVLTLGALAERAGPSVALLSMACAGVLAGCLCLYRYPELRS